MLIRTYFIFALFCAAKGALYYDSYLGTTITEEDVKRHNKDNTTFWCVNEIAPCDPHEWRRVDGSCNNLKHVQRGAPHTPFIRLLPPAYDKNFEPRRSSSGNELPGSRFLRTSLVSAGKVPSHVFSMLASHYMVFMAGDIVSTQDTVNYVLWRPYCCKERGKNDSMCIPNKIPVDDPVHRFSGHRCLNLTKPESFQSIGCVKNDTTPERISTATSLFDLSLLYGTDLKLLMENGRLFKGGLLKYEIEDGKIWPPSYNGTQGVCYINQRPKERRCHRIMTDVVNTLAGVNLMAVWFWRYHNFFASQLAEMNPCWDDDRLFETARDINIAVFLQIYYYELSPHFYGYDNMVRDRVIDPHGGFRDEYNEHILPQLSLEYPYALRWMHNIQDGAIKLYDKNGHYLKQIPVVNLTARTGFYAVDNNMDYITQGSFRQGSAKPDYIADPDMTERALGSLQAVTDVVTSDLAKGRYSGFQPYIKYLKVCFDLHVHTFADLRGIIDEERIEVFKDVYESVEDIDLLAGIWAEIPMRGGHVPPTLYCIVIDQMKRNVYSDRHWYERPNRPHAFTHQQLSEIRKASIARLLCDVGDSVEAIQRQAFLRPTKTNPIISCKHIDSMDLWAWKDPTCGFSNPIFISEEA